MISIRLAAEGEWALPERLLVEGLSGLLKREGHQDGEISLGKALGFVEGQHVEGAKCPFAAHDGHHCHAGQPRFGKSRQAPGIRLIVVDDSGATGVHNLCR